MIWTDIDPHLSHYQIVYGHNIKSNSWAVGGIVVAFAHVMWQLESYALAAMFVSQHRIPNEAKKVVGDI